MPPSLTTADLLHCTRRLPPAVITVLKKFPGQLFVAGGFIRAVIAGEAVADIDLIAASPEVARDAMECLRTLPNFRPEPPETPRRMLETQNAYTVWGLGGVPVQVIHRWTYASVSRALKEFDFTIACASLYWTELTAGKPETGLWMSETHPDYYADLAARRLVYQAPNRVEDAGGSMLRVLKFARRGYSIPLDSLGTVIARIALGVHWGAWGIRDEAEIALIITGLLREVDPLVDPDHIAH